jgi:alkanesulfonate monooxygenase SsuD/methylene tetrahydromethanopterin reductase-like flavin-dependent oxidoreductase (luciferase family)
MRELWSEDEAAFSGEFVSFSASWAWPKPVQAHIPTLIGAFGNARLFSWIVESADGWITTPIEENAENFRLLQQMWEDGGREGSPYIVVLDERTDEASLARWQELGVDEILFGLPDGPESEARAFLEERAALISKFA